LEDSLRALLRPLGPHVLRGSERLRVCCPHTTSRRCARGSNSRTGGRVERRSAQNGSRPSLRIPRAQRSGPRPSNSRRELAVTTPPLRTRRCQQLLDPAHQRLSRSGLLKGSSVPKKRTGHPFQSSWQVRIRNWPLRIGQQVSATVADQQRGKLSPRCTQASVQSCP